MTGPAADLILDQAGYTALTGDPADVSAYLQAATTAARRYAGWRIGPTAAETFILDGDGGHTVSLPSLHVTALSALAYNGASVDPAAVQWSERGYFRAPFGGCWPARLRSITVTIEHGYPDVSDVAAVLASSISRAKLSPGGLTSETVGAMSVSFAQTAPGVSGGMVLMAHERTVLDLYRIPLG